MSTPKAFFAVPLLLAMWLIFVLSTHRPPQVDESFTYMRYAQSPLMALFFYELPNNHLLHSFGVWIATSLMGDSLLAIRFVSLSAGLLCAAQLFRLTGRFFGVGAGALAAALLMIVPLWADMIPNARGYSLSAFLTLIFVEMIYFSGDRLLNPARRALAGICFLLVLTLPSMALLIGAGGLWAVWRGWRAGDWQLVLKNYLPPMVFGTLLGGIFYASAILLHITSFQFTEFGEANFGDLAARWLREVFDSFPGLALLAGMAAGFFVVWRGKRGLLLLIVTIFGVALAVTLAQNIITGKVFFARNYYYLIPLIALLAGAGLARLLRFSTLAQAAAVVALLVVGAAGFQALDRSTSDIQFIDQIGSHVQPGDILWFGCCIDYPARYVYRDRPELFTYTRDTRRIILVPTKFRTLDEFFVLAEADHIPIMRDSCSPDQWGSADVLICPVTTF